MLLLLVRLRNVVGGKPKPCRKKIPSLHQLPSDVDVFGAIQLHLAGRIRHPTAPNLGKTPIEHSTTSVGVSRLGTLFLSGEISVHT